MNSDTWISQPRPFFLSGCSPVHNLEFCKIKIWIKIIYLPCIACIVICMKRRFIMEIFFDWPFTRLQLRFSLKQIGTTKVHHSSFLLLHGRQEILLAIFYHISTFMAIHIYPLSDHSFVPAKFNKPVSCGALADWLSRSYSQVWEYCVVECILERTQCHLACLEIG